MNEESKEEGPRVIEQRDDLQKHGTKKEESTALEDMRKREDCNIDIGISNELFSEPSNQKQTKLMFNLPMRK